MPSQRKNSFFNQSDNSTHRLSAEQLKTLCSELQTQLNVKIIFNGTTSWGQKILASNIQNKKNECELRKVELSDINTKYARFIQYFWVGKQKKDIRNNYLIRKEEKAEVNGAIWTGFTQILPDKFLDTNKLVKKDLTYEELLELNQLILKKMPQHFLNYFDVLINLYQNDHPKIIQNVCLSTEQAIQEMRQIQGELKEDELVCYEFTNNHSIGEGHFELFVIKSEVIIKTIGYAVDYPSARIMHDQL